MRQRARLTLTIAAAAFLASRELEAQEPQRQEGEVAVFRADTRLVLLPATVVDKNGHLVTNLPQKAFKVLENGVEQQIRVFKREDVPVSMGIVIDNSGSMRDKRQKVEASAMTLVKASNPSDEMFIVNFNDEAFLDRDFTSNTKELEEGLTKIDSRGGTAMRDAVLMSMDHLKLKAKRDKKVLLVITDGDDNSSANSLEKLVREAQQSEVLVYAIGLLTEEANREAKRAKRALDNLTEATGGQAYYPKELADVDKIAQKVAHEIRNQYVLAYSPANQSLDGGFRQIKVMATGPNRPTVRTRSGYYATKEAGGAKRPSD